MNKASSVWPGQAALPGAVPPVFEASQPLCSCAQNDPIAAAYEEQASASAGNDIAFDARAKDLPEAASEIAETKTGPGAEISEDEAAPAVYDHSGYVAASGFVSVLSPADASALVSVSAPTYGTAAAGDGYFVTASFQGASDKQIWVSAALGDAAAAAAVAQDVAWAIGQVPLAFLDYVDVINVYGDTGNGIAFSAAYWANELNIYNGLGSTAMEEILIHEFGHLVVDEMMANDPALLASWQAAQSADGIFISQYAEDFASREDAAESLLTYIMVRLYPDRLDPARVAELELTFQNRFDFFDGLGIDYSTAARDVSFQANNNYFLYDPSETGGFWEASNNLLTNDFDVSGQGLRVVAVDGMAFDGAQYLAFAEGGSVWIDSTGQIDFNAAGGFGDMLGGDRETRSFTYTVENAAGQQDTATVSLIVQRPAEAVQAGGTETFDTGASDWSDNTTTLVDGNGYLGGFDGTDRVAKTFILGPEASSARIAFDFLEIDSWDSESFFITLNGQEINLGTFAWSTREGATSFAVGDITITKSAEAALTGYGNLSTSSWYASDGMHGFVIDMATPGEAVTVGFSSNLSSGVTDESWGIDNLTVTPLRSLPVLSITADAASVTEGSAGTVTQMAFTVSLSSASMSDVTADVAIAGNATGAASVVIPAGSTSVPLVLSIAGDDVFEANETITVTLSNLTGAEAGSLTASQDVIDDDVSVQASNDAFFYAPSETGGYWEASNNLLANDVDGSGQALQVVALNGTAFVGAQYLAFAEGGSVWVDSSGQIDFDAAGSFGTLAAGESATRSFTYTVENAAGQQDSATVSLIVERPNEAVSYFDSFDNGAAEWSFNRTTRDSGNTYLGRFGDDYTERSFALGQAPATATVAFDFLEIDSWDGEDFFVFVNGQAINLGSFSWSVDEGADSFVVGDVTVTREAAVGIEGYGSGRKSWNQNDSLHHVTLDVASPGDTLTLGFSSTLDQNLRNESWGIDNLSVDVFDFV